MRRLPQSRRQIGRQEIVVLEESEEAEIGRQAANKNRTPPPRPLRALQPDSRREISEREREQ